MGRQEDRWFSTGAFHRQTPLGKWAHLSTSALRSSRGGHMTERWTFSGGDAELAICTEASLSWEGLSMVTQAGTGGKGLNA